ncbi:MAG: hypothetical protein HC902_14785 [Calothrix sp. SM1_5_4]|nr:hypothetical protein [Calothrix sp. SM1_5_4]
MGSLPGCASKRQSASAAEVRADDRRVIQEELIPEISLKSDRAELNELRKEIPAEKQKANDELALFLSMMKAGTEQPSLVRDRFHALVQKKRAVFREKVDRLREDYRVSETRRREEFMNAQKKARDEYFRKRREPRDARNFKRRS